MRRTTGGGIPAKGVPTGTPSPYEGSQVYAILDNLSTHRAVDVLLWALTHPRREFVFQPIPAAYLNLIEPWWKVLRSLALTGRRFETWQEVCGAVEQATTYWNARTPAPLHPTENRPTAAVDDPFKE